MYPDGVARLARTDDPDQVRAIVDSYPVREPTITLFL
jgi:hypothetical protein